MMLKIMAPDFSYYIKTAGFHNNFSLYFFILTKSLTTKKKKK